MALEDPAGHPVLRSPTQPNCNHTHVTEPDFRPPRSPSNNIDNTKYQSQISPNDHLIGSPKTEELISIVPRTTKPSGYQVFSLHEELKDNRTGYRLSCNYAADLPQSLLDAFLVDSLPEHLCCRNHADAREIHVVVSTRSGTGRARDFYDSVLQPLLHGIGLWARDTRSLTNQDGEEQELAESCSYDLTITKDVQSIQNFAAKLKLAHPEKPGYSGTKHTVILLSGDGGVIELLNGVAPADPDNAPVSPASLPLVAVLPLGTGNALFHSLHKPVVASHGSPEPSPLVLALRTLLKGREAPLPSFCAKFSPGCRSITYDVVPSKDGKTDENGANTVTNTTVEERASPVASLFGAIVASYGFHSQLVWESDTPAYRQHSDKRFNMVATELLKESHAYDVSVEVIPGGGGGGGGATKDESELSLPRTIPRSRHAYVLATLVSNLEKTFTISPASQPLDGKLRLVHFGDVEGERTMDIMMQAYDNGKHVEMEWPATTAATDPDGQEGAAGEQAGLDHRRYGSASTPAKIERVGYDVIQEVKVTTREQDARWRKVCIDGVIVELPVGGSMTVRKAAVSRLNIMIDRSL